MTGIDEKEATLGISIRTKKVNSRMVSKHNP
jgi:hypothetical protein